MDTPRDTQKDSIRLSEIPDPHGRIQPDPTTHLDTHGRDTDMLRESLRRFTWTHTGEIYRQSL